MSEAAPAKPALTRAQSKYLELIGELEPNAFHKARSPARADRLLSPKAKPADAPAPAASPAPEAAPPAAETPSASTAVAVFDGGVPGGADWAARKVASVFAMALARRLAARRAARLYQRFWEPHWSAEYYYNPLTRASAWERPKLLLDEKIPFADEASEAAATEHAILAATVPPPKTWRERMARMKETNPKGAFMCVVVVVDDGLCIRGWRGEAGVIAMCCHLHQCFL